MEVCAAHEFKKKCCYCNNQYKYEIHYRHIQGIMGSHIDNNMHTRVPTWLVMNMSEKGVTYNAGTT